MMTVSLSVADVLSERVTLQVESIDRLYLNLYQPRLMHAGGVAQFFRSHQGATFASSALMAPMTRAFQAAVLRFAETANVPVVRFAKGQRKDDVMHAHLAGFTAEEGVLFVGIAQEKAPVFRTQRRYSPDGRPYPWLVRSTAMVNQYYLYVVDADVGPLFIKFCSYFPYTGRVCLNGHEYAKRQAAKAGIGFTALDNGFLAGDDPVAVQRICDRLSPAKIDAVIRKWPVRHPRTVPDPGDHRRRDAEPARRLQAFQDQAVPQVTPRPAHRDNHQRHLRLRDRQAARSPARTAAGRLLRQPTPATRPTAELRPDPRRRGVRPGGRPGRRRHPTRPRTAFR